MSSPIWIEKNNQLYKSFQFQSFTKAFAFMVSVAFEAEKMNHHPIWKNNYNTVEIWLTTHSMNSTVTEKDYSLAKAIDDIFENK